MMAMLDTEHTKTEQHRAVLKVPSSRLLSLWTFCSEHSSSLGGIYNYILKPNAIFKVSRVPNVEVSSDVPLRKCALDDMVFDVLVNCNHSQQALCQALSTCVCS